MGGLVKLRIARGHGHNSLSYDIVADAYATVLRLFFYTFIYMLYRYSFEVNLG